MGKKRNRTALAAVASNAAADSPSDSLPCSSRWDLTPAEQNSSHPDDSSIFQPLFSMKDIMDTHGKQPNSQLSLGQHHYNLNRAMYLKRSRHHYANQYSRRNAPNYHRPSTSFGKGSPAHNERLCFKLGSRYGSEFGNRPDLTEFTEKGSWQPERIRTSSSVIGAEGLKTECGICEKPLKRKPFRFGSNVSISPTEALSIVAILVCGHIYHADCLEERTPPDDLRDPPCPICSGLLIPKAEEA